MTPIPPAERAWAEHLLAVMALAPDTRDDYTNQPIGMPNGANHGSGMYDLACVSCDATWTGVPGDPCWWCARAAEIQTDHQIDLLLQAPDVHPDDVRYVGMMTAWAERLVVGVEAGLITERQAHSATRNADRRVA